MTYSKISTLIHLIQWRVDEGIDLKDAYNYVVIHFREGVTEDERQELVEYFYPIQQQVTTMPQVMTIASTFASMYSPNHPDLDIIESIVQKCELPYTRNAYYLAVYCEVTDKLRAVAHLDGRLELTLNTMRNHD